jgi:hypothetical protein
VQIGFLPVDREKESNQLGQFFIADKPYKNMLNVGDRSVSQERRRLRDRLSDDQDAKDLFKRFLGKCND